jgi:hypothetical protein
MNRRPLSITIIAVIYLLEPFGNLAVAAYANRIPLLGKQGVLAHLIWSDWLILAMFPVVALGVFMVRRWGWYLFLGFSLVLIGYNLWVYGYINPHYSLGTVIAFVVMITAVSAVFFRKHVYSPYFNPRLRWWEIPARYRVAINTQILTDRHGALVAQTADISESGCFVVMSSDLQVGEQVWLVLSCRGTQINCLGRVVRQADSGGSDCGYGIMFQAMPREARLKIRHLVRSLAKLGGQDRSGDVSETDIPTDFDRRESRWSDNLALTLKALRS